MDEIKIAYKDDYPCIYEGINNYLSMFSLKRKKYFIICAIVTLLNLIILNLDLIIEDYDLFFIIFEFGLLLMFFICTVLYYYLYVKIHSKQIASTQFVQYKEQEKEIVLRQNDILFLRKYCKSNYYYDEITVVEGKKSIAFIIDKNSYPIVISKTTDNEKEISLICLKLKEKVGDRFIDKTKGVKRR